MGFGNPYQFYLMDGANYLYVSGGSVLSTGTPTELEYAPANWENISLSWERGWTYNALMRLYSSEFKFVKDGAKIIRWAFYISGGVEKNIKLVIKKLNPTIAGNMAYEDFVECEVDLSTFKDSFSEVEVNLIEGGFISKLKSRENTTYELDVVNNADRIWIRHDGIKLDCILRWGVLAGSFPQAFTALVLPTSFYIDKEGTNIALTPVSVDFATLQSRFVINLSDDPIDLDIHLILNADAIMDPGNTVNGVVKVRYEMTQFNPLAFTSHTVVHTQGGLTPGSTTNIALDQHDTITLPSNHALEFHLICDDGAGGGPTNNYQIDFLDGGYLKVSYNNTYQETYIPALRPKKILDHLIEQIGDATTTADSTLLDSTHPDKVLTSGDAIRGLENSKMKLSFMDFWRSVHSVYCTALSYDKVSDIVSIELFESAFNDMVFVDDLGDINNFKASPLTSELFSKLKAGFGSYTYDEINGKDEFNQLTEFLMPITKSTNEKDITSTARADMYGIENVRMNLTGKLTTDADTDNDLFWIHIDSASSGTVPTGLPGAGEPYYNLYRKPIDLAFGPDYWQISNLRHEDTAYNIFFSAKRQLSRWAPYLSSILFLLDAEYIKFQGTTKDTPEGTKLLTDEGDPIISIDESANELVSNYLPGKFKPVIFDFNFPDKSALATAIASAPNGYFTFNHKGLPLEGFILKIVTKPKLETQSCTMLATWNCDLLNLLA